MTPNKQWKKQHRWGWGADPHSLCSFCPFHWGSLSNSHDLNTVPYLIHVKETLTLPSASGRHSSKWLSASAPCCMVKTNSRVACVGVVIAGNFPFPYTEKRYIKFLMFLYLACADFFGFPAHEMLISDLTSNFP